MLDLSGLKKYLDKGYYKYYYPEHHLSNKSGFVYEHMIMAEELLGRDLNFGEVVHHKDRNRINNSIDNLMVFKTNADHAAYHAGCHIELDGDVYVAIDKQEKVCPLCGEFKHGMSDVCLRCYRKKIAENIPSKDVLEILICEYNFCEIGRKYNVSDNAVRKWCKKYNLPFRKKDIETFKNSRSY